MKRKLVASIALPLFFYFPVQQTPAIKAAVAKIQPDSMTIPNSWKQEMLDEVNKIRKAGCRCGRQYLPPAPPVSWNNKLEKATQLHAKDMDEHNFMGHRGSNGSDIGDRAAKAKYNWQLVAENVSWNYDTPSDAVLGWKTSPGHCRNMMGAGYKEMGAAKQGLFWAQMFGRQVD